MRARAIDSSSAARTAGSSVPSRGGDDLGGHAQPLRPDAVEALRGVEEGGGPAVADVVDDRTDGGQRRLDVELRARQRRAQLAQAGARSPAGPGAG